MGLVLVIIYGAARPLGGSTHIHNSSLPVLLGKNARRSCIP